MIKKDLLDELHKVVMQTGSPLEGNVCYHHHTEFPLDDFHPSLETKRSNLVKLANQFENILEIGFNAGHSAAIMLSANNKVKVTSVDIGIHKYTVPCAGVIQEYFGDRHRFLLQSSRQITEEELTNINAVIIDGDHSPSGFFLDLALCITYCTIGTVIVIDDWNDPVLRNTFKLLEDFFSKYQSLEDNEDQGFFLLSKMVTRR